MARLSTWCTTRKVSDRKLTRERCRCHTVDRESSERCSYQEDNWIHGIHKQTCWSRDANRVAWCDSATSLRVWQDGQWEDRIDYRLSASAREWTKKMTRLTTKNSMVDETALCFQGVPETETNTTRAIMGVCQASLSANLELSDIDRSHTNSEDTTRKSTHIIVKFTSYESRNTVFAAKRKLKGINTVITENLTNNVVICWRKPVPQHRSQPHGQLMDEWYVS